MNTDKIVYLTTSENGTQSSHHTNQWWECEITFKTKDAKSKILKDGIIIGSTRVQFGDDAKRVFNITICGLPTEFDGKRLFKNFQDLVISATLTILFTRQGDNVEKW